jgi:phosphatidylglycerol:prolipoprotein diacylglycerol transferase
MVPYIHVPDLHIGPLPLHPFGILVATGVLVGTSITARRARKLGYDVIQLNSFVTWMLVSAFVCSHILDSVFYHWDEAVRNPLSVIKLWEGLSSFGGFVGAVIGIVLWKYFVIDDVWPRRRRRAAPILPFADLVLSVFPIGWMFGRAGCATVHDHPGARATADTFLAVAYPRSSHDWADVTKVGFIEFVHGHDPKFDLGFLELLFTIMLASCFALTWRRRLPIGTYVIASGLAYAPVRFAMDFLRVPADDGGDTRYGDLTPAQWSCMVLFLYAVVMIFYVRRLQARGIDLSQSLRDPLADPPSSSGGGAKAPA